MCAAKICWLALDAHHGWSLGVEPTTRVYGNYQESRREMGPWNYEGMQGNPRQCKHAEARSAALFGRCHRHKADTACSGLETSGKDPGSMAFQMRRFQVSPLGKGDLLYPFAMPLHLHSLACVPAGLGVVIGNA